MRDGVDILKTEIRKNALIFEEMIKNNGVEIVARRCVDGATSAAMFTKALRELDVEFSVKFADKINSEVLGKLSKTKIILFLDIASEKINEVAAAELKDIFVLDHHDISSDVPSNVYMTNAASLGNNNISTSGLSYLFCKEFYDDYESFSRLAVLGMISDSMDNHVDYLGEGIIDDSSIKRKRGLLFYPATRPINRTLEFSISPFIPGVTGNSDGVLGLLSGAGVKASGGKFKSTLEFDSAEVEAVIEGVQARSPNVKRDQLMGNIFLVKMFSRLEDARELISKIRVALDIDNGLSSLLFCLEKEFVKTRVESSHVKHKQHIVSGLKYVSSDRHISGDGFVIINSGENINNKFLEDVFGLISSSVMYKEGTSIIAMANGSSGIDVFACSVGKAERNLKEVLSEIVSSVEGTIEGDSNQCRCCIPFDKGEEFLSMAKKCFGYVEVMPVSKEEGVKAESSL